MKSKLCKYFGIMILYLLVVLVSYLIPCFIFWEILNPFALFENEHMFARILIGSVFLVPLIIMELDELPFM